MQEIVLEDISAVCKVRVSKRAKRLSLRVLHDGTVEAVIPQRMSLQQAESFIRSKQDWIGKTLKQCSKRVTGTNHFHIQDGIHIPCFQEQYQLSISINSRRIRALVKEDGDTLHIEGSGKSAIKKALIQWYKKKAKDYFVGQSLMFAKRAGVSVENIRVRDMRTRWGSAAIARKSLTYNWRLALAPEAAARYVVAHEVAHLLHADHSKRFWRVVEQLYPEYIHYRKWLKQFGFSLQFS